MLNKYGSFCLYEDLINSKQLSKYLKKKKGKKGLMLKSDQLLFDVRIRLERESVEDIAMRRNRFNFPLNGANW